MWYTWQVSAAISSEISLEISSEFSSEISLEISHEIGPPELSYHFLITRMFHIFNTYKKIILYILSILDSQ